MAVLSGSPKPGRPRDSPSAQSRASCAKVDPDSRTHDAISREEKASDGSQKGKSTSGSDAVERSRHEDRARPEPHIRNTPNFVSGMGAFKAAEKASPRTRRVSEGRMMPSSQRRAVAWYG